MGWEWNKDLPPINHVSKNKNMIIRQDEYYDKVHAGFHQNMYGGFGLENLTSEEPQFLNISLNKDIDNGFGGSNYQNGFDIYKPSVESWQSGSDYEFSNFEKQMIVKNSHRNFAFNDNTESDKPMEWNETPISGNSELRYSF